MRSLHRFSVGAALALAAVFVAAPVEATLLSDLVNSNGKIEIGDKIFDNFQVTILGVMPYSADLANIQVNAEPNENDYQLTFTSASGGGPIISADPNAYVDVLIGFDVTVKKDSAFLITDVNLSFHANAPANGLAQIAETVYYDPFDPNVQPTLLQVSTLGSSNTPDIPLPGAYTKIRVYKDITVIGGQSEDTSIDSFMQTFIQTPEPAAMSLLVVGSLVVLRRRVVRRPAVWGVALALAFGGLLMQPGTASAVLLSTLDGTSATYSYKNFTFSKFEFDVVVAGSAGKYIANPEAIDVQGFTTPFGGEDGLRFVGLIAALSNVAPNSRVEITLSYDVEVKAGGPGITDVTMSFNGAPTSTDGKARVDKGVLNKAGGEVIDALSVWNEPGKPDDPKIKLQDHVNLANVPVDGYASVHVEDTIIVHGGASGATTISYINQTFSVIPEPAVILMVLLGLPLLNRRRGR